MAMIKFPVFGLTGCIGSGKSTAASILGKLGYAIVDADDLAREVVKPNTDGLKELVAEFGGSILTKEGELNRAALGHIIFSDSNKRIKAEKILHPKIRACWLSKLKELQNLQQYKAAIYVVPLLFESNADFKEINAVITISSTKELSIMRVMERSKLTREDILNRLSGQLPNEIKCSKSDYVVDNCGTTTALEKMINKLDETLRKRFYIN